MGHQDFQGNSIFEVTGFLLGVVFLCGYFFVSSGQLIESGENRFLFPAKLESDLVSPSSQSSVSLLSTHLKV